MPKWTDFGNIWSTLRELDVNAIRDESERPLTIAAVGHTAALEQLEALLRRGPERYPIDGPNPLEVIPIERASERAADLSGADMLLLAVDTRQSLSPAETASFGKLEALSAPFLVALFYGERMLPGQAALSPMIRARTVAIADPAALDAADKLATAVLARLPAELHLAAARRLPGLRAIYARDLIGATSLTNATYSLASGVPEQIPILSIPFAAADIIVLTKNQALLVYRLALAYGAPPEFQSRIREVIPVIGGAFLWRQAARSLVGLIPVWGIVPKVAIAYAGTYTTGVVAWRWFESGEIVSTEQMKQISREAIAIGRARAREIIASARNLADQAAARTTGEGGLASRIKHAIPFRRKQRELNPPKKD
ncbi:MAG TPA: hypothetical protein VKE41_04030 [Roseiflexaceae bacterium]|nr:hypothetical protein [Roseiflexaceae bacterium]